MTSLPSIGSLWMERSRTLILVTGHEWKGSDDSLTVRFYFLDRRDRRSRSGPLPKTWWRSNAGQQLELISEGRGKKG